MSRKSYDPLAYIPSADVIRRQLEEMELLASRLRVLLRVSEEISQTDREPDQGQAGAGVTRAG
jgi:hypothetical protein